jgi:hypothetical protein
MDIEDANILVVDSMDMCRFVFFRFEEHFDDNPIESTNLRHMASALSVTKIMHFSQSTAKIILRHCSV